MDIRIHVTVEHIYIWSDFLIKQILQQQMCKIKCYNTQLRSE